MNKSSLNSQITEDGNFVYRRIQTSGIVESLASPVSVYTLIFAADLKKK